MAFSPPFLVGIAGGSGSGKTSLALVLGHALRPAIVARIAQDAYYRDRSSLPPAARVRLNFDIPEALDLDLFVDDLRTLRRGERVWPPRYCFVTHCRHGRDEPIGPADIVLVDGLLLFADARTRDLLDL